MIVRHFSQVFAPLHLIQLGFVDVEKAAECFHEDIQMIMHSDGSVMSKKEWIKRVGQIGVLTTNNEYTGACDSLFACARFMKPLLVFGLGAFLDILGLDEVFGWD